MFPISRCAKSTLKPAPCCSPKGGCRTWLAFTALAVALSSVTLLAVAQEGTSPAAPTPAAKPALTVTVTTPQSSDWPQVLATQGNIAAWQEAVIGAELTGLRLSEVSVDVGDVVRKGQLLARINSDTVAADVAQATAAVQEAEADLAEAKANATRTRDLGDKGFVSSQSLTQVTASEQTASARLAAARARLQAEEVRLSQTRILAPDDGIISVRTATVGSLTQPGEELFRLIRGNRLEWRAEVSAADVVRIKPGMTATLRLPGGGQIKGSVRTVAPTVDPQTRIAIVYVDLPTSRGEGVTRAGMFARGEFELGRATALTVPQSALLLREGFSYVFRLEEDNKVAQTKVSVGRRANERVEIIGGLDPSSRIVAAGAGFLADGDTVRVVDSTTP